MVKPLFKICGGFNSGFLGFRENGSSEFKEIFGKKLVSVYINGSVATGDAIENKSDIDTNAVVDMTEDEINQVIEKVLLKEMKELSGQISFVSKVELHAHPKNNWSERKRFQMKITGICVYGKNYDNEIPEYKLSKETFQKFRVSVSNDIKKAQIWLTKADTPSEIKNIFIHLIIVS